MTVPDQSIKILVTGAKGQLGNEIRVLAAKYYDFNFTFIDVDELDLTDRDSVSAYFKKNSFNYVINCAAYTAVDKAESDKETAFKVNAGVPELLGELTAKSGARVIHISTDYVFDGSANTPYDESRKVNPVSVYGASKLEGEQRLLSKNPESVIIRTAWLYSAFGNNFVKTMIKLGSERNLLKVVYDQVGTPTYAVDLASVILQIIEKVEKKHVKFIPGIYHYSNEGVTSWYDFAFHILKLQGIDCKIIPVTSDEFPAPAHRPSYSVLSKQKIRETFDVEVPYWYDGLVRMLSVFNS
ncbi:MAG: dTDP-4-dehydrorhamnose reductase [Chlorobi bacterium]|nr:dTDP-4-dehydrorhamnose reductase [Chlorobiota bacterium]